MNTNRNIQCNEVPGRTARRNRDGSCRVLVPDSLCVFSTFLYMENRVAEGGMRLMLMLSTSIHIRLHPFRTYYGVHNLTMYSTFLLLLLFLIIVLNIFSIQTLCNALRSECRFISLHTIHFP